MNSSPSNHYDVIIIGGGPAGSTVATLLADKGRKVLVIEREVFPRFHIGESLMTETWWTFKRLGVLDKLKKTNFVRKHAVRFVNPSGKESQPYYFEDVTPHESAVTWQVVRSEFDKILLDNAAEHGAEVWQNTNVTEILLEPSPIDNLPKATGVMASRSGAPPVKLTAKIIVDATGTGALLSKKLGIRHRDPRLKKAAFFAHYKGAWRDTGRDEGTILVLANKTQDGWFWYIPLPDDVVSIGVVGELDRLITGRDAKPEQTLDDEIKNCAGLESRLQNATRVSPVHVLSDFSYRSSRCAGDGWILVGDAFGFLDPMYSSGVLLALKSGEMAADCINEAFARNDFSPELLGRWGGLLAEGMSTVRKLVYAFYTKGFSFGKFNREHPEQRNNLVDVLIGNVFRDGVEELFKPLSETVEVPPSIPLDNPPALSSHKAPKIIS